jgi:hypothetical protein
MVMQVLVEPTPAGRGRPQRQLYCARHFALLASIAALLSLTRAAHLAPGVSSQFALYGALHAGALALSMRLRRSAWRQLGFLGAAALLSLLTVRLGLAGLPLAATLAPGTGPVAMLGLSSLGGGLGYGFLLRGVLNYRLPLAALAPTALACASAAVGALIVGRRVQLLSGLWLAVPWWLVFSAGLCCDDSWRARSDANALNTRMS